MKNLLSRLSRFSMRRLLAVARKELIHLRRDRRMLPIVFLVPMLQLTVLGLAANLDVENVKLVVVDNDHSPLSRSIPTRLGAGDAFDIISVTDHISRAEQLMDSAQAEAAVIIPRGTARKLHRWEKAEIPIWIDGTDTNRALGAQRYLEQILADISAEAVPTVSQVQPMGLPEPRARVLYNPTFQSQWFMVPGVLAMILTVTILILSSMAIVKERENGTIEQLSVTPIRPGELICGKLAPFVLIGLIEGVLVTLVAIFGFQVPFRGSYWQLAGMSATYVASMLALGLLVSTVSQTQQQAMLSSMLVILPSFLLGGLMYPLSNMEPWARYIADFLPLRYFIVILRGLFLKGTGYSSLSHEANVMAVIGLVLLVFAVFRFRKRSA